MDFIKILMMICLFMGVTIAFKTLGVSNSDPIHNTWDLFERNEEATEDLPDFRRNPSHKTSSIAMDDAFDPLCPSTTFKVKVEERLESNGKKKLVPKLEFVYETICNEPGESDNVVRINSLWHKVCETGEAPSNPQRRAYCYQVEASVRIPFIVHIKRGHKFKSTGRTEDRYMNMKTGCSCGKQTFTAKKR